MDIAILAEEGRSFRAQSGRAEEIFGGSFHVIRTTKERLSEAGFDVYLFILTTQLGLIPSSQTIREYRPEPQSLQSERFTRRVARTLGRESMRHGTLIVTMSIQYAECLARAVAMLDPKTFQPKPVVFIVSGGSILSTLAEVFTPFSSYITLFEKPGVAPITKDARRSIIRALQAKSRSSSDSL